MEMKKVMWMLKKDLIVLWRHKPRLISIILFPILMITLFGYGMGGTLENIPVVIVEQSSGPVTDQTVDAMRNMSLYDIKDILKDPEIARDMVDAGEVKAAIILPPNYDNLTSSEPTVVMYLDSSDQLASQALVPATQALFSKLSGQLAVERMQGTSMNAQNSTPGSGFQSMVSTINLQIDRIYGDVKYMDFLVPAILAMTIMFSCMFGMGQSIAGERERGELARLFMTPTSVSTVVGGKIISKLVIESGRALLLLFIAILLFGIKINGSMLLTVLLLILTALCFVGFGIMISARVGTQEDYMQMVMPFAMPMMFVSGVFYPIETMPWIFQKIAYVVPLTYANNALRAVMLKGAGAGDIMVNLLVLGGFTLLFFAMGVTRFNRDI
ncbi:MAG: ABC transporter permease [Methanothermobacter thermautotrophicus]|jgi:ABC-2 type transport system permease protein